MRTKPNRLVEPYLRAYEELKMRVFAKLFVDASTDGTLSEDLNQARNLDGRFNLGNSLKITHMAFVALVAESRSTVICCFATFDPDQHLGFLSTTAERKPE
jgi:hypothetical protein